MSAEKALRPAPNLSQLNADEDDKDFGALIAKCGKNGLADQIQMQCLRMSEFDRDLIEFACKR